MKKKVLFVCLANMQRSPTAERLAREEFGEHFEAQSRGIYENCAMLGGQQIQKEDLEWADEVVAMENEVRNYIHRLMRMERMQPKPIECLHIPDQYERNDPNLCDILRRKIGKRIEHGEWEVYP